MADRTRDPEDYLFIILDGQFYRFSKDQIINGGDAVEDGTEVSELLATLTDDGAVLSDITSSDGGTRPDSCVCVALNITYFDKSLKAKRRAVVAMNKEIAAKRAAKATKGKRS